eukprot:2737063-Rhodomonas_salina.2
MVCSYQDEAGMSLLGGGGQQRAGGAVLDLPYVVLRRCYAMPGTDLAYHATRMAGGRGGEECVAGSTPANQA